MKTFAHPSYVFKKLLGYVYLINKYGQTDKLLSKLNDLPISDEIKTFVLTFPDKKYIGYMIGFLTKNPNASTSDLQSIVDFEIKKQNLKDQTKQKIKMDLPEINNDNLKAWILIQIKKNPNNRKLILENLNKILHYTSNNKVELASFDANQLIDKSNKFSKIDFNEIENIDEYLLRASQFATDKINLLLHEPLKLWAFDRLNKLLVVWKDNMLSEIYNDKSFSYMINEARKINDDINNGLFRDKELPNLALNNTSYDNLVSNIESLDDWAQNENPNFHNLSVNEAIKLSKEWHNEVANEGLRLKYDPINQSNIVYGPNNWKDPKNSGFIILELKSKNDLKVEGSKMSHCVGTYVEKVNSGQSRIFSLRNIQNIMHPILTIETDKSGGIVRQDKGPSNTKIDQKYHDMVTEWSSNNKIDYSTLEYTDKLKLSQNKNTPPEVLIELSKDKDQYVKQSVARNPNAPHEVLITLSKDKDSNVRCYVAQSPNTPHEALIELSKDKDDFIRKSVAKNPNAPPEALITLSKDESEYIRQYVADNRNAPPEALMALSKDDNITRRIVARNPSTPSEALIELSKDKDDFIREHVAKNPNAPPEALIILSNDKYYPIRMSISRNPNAPPKALTILSGDKDDVIVIDNLAKNPNTPPEVLTILSKDKDNHIREYVAQNPNTPPEALIELSKDKDRNVRRYVEQNPNTPYEAFWDT